MAPSPGLSRPDGVGAAHFNANAKEICAGEDSRKPRRQCGVGARRRGGAGPCGNLAHLDPTLRHAAGSRHSGKMPASLPLAQLQVSAWTVAAGVDTEKQGPVLPGPLTLVLCPLERDDFSSRRHRALAYCWSMIFFRKPVSIFRGHALGRVDIHRIKTMKLATATNDA